MDITPKTLWNFDEARMKDLHYHMVLCELAFENWNLLEIYKELHTLRRIVSGAFSEKEWDSTLEDYSKLEEAKRKLEEAKEEEHQEKLIKYYSQADDVFIKLNRFMKKKGFFFREGEDPRFAALKR